MILLTLIAAYSNSWQGPFVFDDPPAIAAAAAAGRTDGLLATLTSPADAGETTSGRPLLLLSLMLNHALSGEQVWSYHALNTLLHALAGLTLFGLIRRTLARAMPGVSGTPAAARNAGRALSIAAATTAVWVLHPLQTAAVTYIVQRAESLAALFLLLTLYSFARSTDSATPLRWKIFSVAACALGMGAKETMVAAPLLVLLYDRTFVSGSLAHAWRANKPYYLGLAASWLVLAALVASTGGRGGTAGFDAAISPWHYFLTQCEAVLHYLRLAAWPHPLVFDYGTSVVRSASEVLLPALVLVGLGVAVAWGVRRRTAWGFLGCVFFLLLAPSSSVVPIASQTIAEHRIYLALAAPVALAVAALYTFLGRFFVPAIIVLAAAEMVLTHARNNDYASERQLWADTVAKRPENARAHHNLGLVEMKDARFDAAVPRFETALRRDPASVESHYNLGLCLVRLGRDAEAVSHYERALVLRPRHVETHNNLGSALLALGRTNEAITHYEQALAAAPDFAEAHSNLADALLRTGETEQALRHSREAVRLKPDFAEAHFNAGNACAEAGRFQEARGHFETALRLAPADARAHNNLGNVLVQLGAADQAITHYERALGLAPDFSDPRRNLALVLLQQGRLAAAEPHLEFLARANPADAQIAAALRQVRMELRR